VDSGQFEAQSCSCIDDSIAPCRRRLSQVFFMQPPNFSLEKKLIRKGIWPVAGVDEAGRGPLAGPVAIAAVILDPKIIPNGIDDSKRLSEDQRVELYSAIMAHALAIAVAFAPAQEIDAINIRAATLLGMRRAVRALALLPAYALIDGRDLPPGLEVPGRAVVGGDGLSVSIAAASIIAKVSRDRLMARLDGHCPGYNFAQHAGYATAHHRAAVSRCGLSPFHRRSFRTSPCLLD
jgi:ribonuclease HII